MPLNPIKDVTDSKDWPPNNREKSEILAGEKFSRLGKLKSSNHFFLINILFPQNTPLVCVLSSDIAKDYENFWSGQ